MTMSSVFRLAIATDFILFLRCRLQMLNNKSSSRYLTNMSTPTTPPASAVDYSYLLAVAFGFIAVMAIIGNGLFCILILKNCRMLRSAYNLLIFSLAVTDMITGKRFQKSNQSFPFVTEKLLYTKTSKHELPMVTNCRTVKVSKEVSYFDETEIIP